MNRKKIISAVLLATVMFSNIGSAQTVLAKNSEVSVSQKLLIARDDTVDFKEKDKRKGKRMGKKKKKKNGS